MGLSMCLNQSQEQARQTVQTLQRQIDGYTSLQKALNEFVYNSEGLSGHAYDSAKAYASTILIPLTRACILLNEGIIQATADFPARYVAEVDSSDLHEDQLLEMIARADKNIVYYRNLWNMEYRSDKPSASLLNSLELKIDLQQDLRRKLQEKLDKLRAFHRSSPQLFSHIDGLYQAVRQGMSQAKSSWNSDNQTFELPSANDLEWTVTVNRRWDSRPSKKSAFEESVDKLTLAELEKTYGDVLEANQRYLRTGSNWSLRSGMSYEDYQYIINRYQKLKEQGDMSLAGKEYLDKMFANLREEDRVAIDKLTARQLLRKYSFVMHGAPSLGIDYHFLSDVDKAKKDYIHYRFGKLMEEQPIDWRDPQFNEKRLDYVNQTGLDPLTGLEADDDLKFTAKYHRPVTAISEFGASIAGGVIDYTEMTSGLKSSKINSGLDDVVPDILRTEKGGHIVGYANGFKDTNSLYYNYNKHYKQVFGALGKNNYSVADYIADANNVIKNGTYVPEMNGYVLKIGGTGRTTKYHFVGLDRATGDITTYHIKYARQIWKKAPNFQINP